MAAGPFENVHIMKTTNDVSLIDGDRIDEDNPLDADIAAYMSCLVEPNVCSWFDPMASVECSLSLKDIGRVTLIVPCCRWWP